MTVAYINRIGTAVPAHDIHQPFLELARSFLTDPRAVRVFDRMAARAGIAHRFSFFKPRPVFDDRFDEDGVYRRDGFPGTAARMQLYPRFALALATRAVAALDVAGEAARITHLIVASCTGFSAPGLDVQLARLLELRASVARTMISFMGCAAAVPALRMANDIVRAAPAARVLVVNVELTTLHLQDTDDLETMLSFILFGDGCSASLVSADEAGLALGAFRAVTIPDTEDLITWDIGDKGFNMHLSGQVPARIAQALRAELNDGGADGILHGEGTQVVEHWAVHGGGRTVLDAVEDGLRLPAGTLDNSRGVLRDFGNMSSATVMFSLQRIMNKAKSGARGMAMAFGPGLAMETFRFRMVE